MSNKTHVLCYGDSNTWGVIGRYQDSILPSKKHDPDHHWPTVLANKLGADFQVEVEGLCGRTTIYSKPTEPWKNGETYLLPCLMTHRPLDLVIIMLGTNDLQIKKDITAQELPIGISRLVDIIQNTPNCGRNQVPPKILLLAPVEVRPSCPEGRTKVFAQFRSEIGRELSLMFPKVYAQVAKEKDCYFLNAAAYAHPSEADGVHFDAESHVCLGNAVADYIKTEIYPSR